jgi:hypothetical protein
MKHTAETYIVIVISIYGSACSEMMDFVKCVAVSVHCLALVRKISTYNFHSSVSIFVLLNY